MPGWLTIDAATVALFLGGLLGAFLRALMGQHATFTRKTLVDILTGGLVGAAYPIFPVAPIRPDAPPVRLFAFGIILGLFGSYLLTWAAWKLGVFRGDPRAAAPGDPAAGAGGGSGVPAPSPCPPPAEPGPTPPTSDVHR